MTPCFIPRWQTSVGDEIVVCVTEIDEKGRVNLATKEGLEKKNDKAKDKGDFKRNKKAKKFEEGTDTKSEPESEE